jgi:hypothetical protein
VFQAQFRHASRCSPDGAGIAFGADDFSGRPDEAARDQSDVTHPGAEVENTLSGTDTRTTEESFRVSGHPRRLTNQTLMLGISAAERILIRVVGR